MAAIHANAMEVPAPWSEADFKDLLSVPGTFVVTAAPSVSLAGFSLGLVVSDEVELLTLAVQKDFQRRGIGQNLLHAFEAEGRRSGGKKAFLEVAASNTAAREMYEKSGWTETGLRKAYYRGPDARIDAILMSKRLATA